MKNKQKRKSSLQKRVIVKSKNLVKKGRANTSHLFFSKENKQKRQLRKGNYLHKSDLNRLKALLY